MKARSDEPDFGATGQFELTGVYFSDKKADAAFATTLGMESIKSLVLVGVGPAQLQVLTQLARNRRSDVDVTLVAPWSYLTYTNMAPGFVAGNTSLDACQIDLQPLLRKSGVRWISARCSGLDANTSSIMLDYGGSSSNSGQQGNSMVSRPSMLTYDFLSIDMGSVMERRQMESLMPGAAEHGLMAKPMEPFLNRWSHIVNQARAGAGKKLRVCVIGAGATGVELVFAMQEGLQKAGVAADIKLVTGGAPLLDNHPAGMQSRVRALLKVRSIELIDAMCTAMQAGAIKLSNGSSVGCDVPVIALGPFAPTWLTHSGLALDATGHVMVNHHLQSTSHKNVFASGEVANHVDRAAGPRNMARANAGPDLALNLLASLTDQPLNKHNPAERGPHFITCGANHAIANWGPFTAEGAWASRWRERTDHAFLNQFRD